MMLIVGCVSQPQPQVKQDPTLPTVQNIRSATDMNAIVFEWVPVDDPRVVGYNIYKQINNNIDSNGTKRMARIAQIPDRYSSHFVDETDLQPNTNYYYTITSYNKDGVESEPSIAHSVKTKSRLESVVWIESINNLPKKAKIIWRPHSNLKVVGYIVERNDIEHPQFEEIGRVNQRLQVEYIDNNLEDNQIYKYRLRAVTFDNVISEPSRVVEVITKKMPENVKNIQASQNKPKQIILAWDKNPEKDIYKYNVYYSDNYNGNYQYLTHVQENKLIDTINVDGVKRFYKITAVDQDRLESDIQKASITDGMTLSKPNPPVLRDVTIKGRAIEIKYGSGDSRTHKFVIIKRTFANWATKKEQRIVTNKTSYLDKDIQPGTQYSYSLVTMDKYEIESKESKESKIIYPKKDGTL